MKMRCLMLMTSLAIIASPAMAETPRLVLQITVDGLRADLLTRYQANFGKGGFRYLLDNGAVFTNTRYLHANTETIVGHTTLATGATPAVHGMVGNVWYHALTGELGYNIEDSDAPIIPTRRNAAAGAQVDPAQLKAATKGRSPRGILAPTFADTLKISGHRDAKVFGVSGKDRSAVAMAGQVGTAYWYSTDTGDFQSSRYYLEDYPDWVSQWNGENRAASLANTQWELMLEPERYVLAGQDDRPYEVDLKGFGRTFPHAYGPEGHPLLFTRVLVSPAGDQLLGSFTRALIEQEDIGQDGVTDYLSVSFSSVDAVNHFFGPSSLENEDTVLQLDRTLAELLSFIDEKVGLKRTLIVLSADHGMAEMPEYATEQGYDARRLYSDEFLAFAREQAEGIFGSSDVIKDFFRPYLYIDNTVINKLGLDKADVVARLGEALVKVDGIAAAVPAARAADYGEQAVAHNHHPTRSGDIYVYPEAHWFFFDRGPIGVMHGSPWAYDNHVPLIFVGPGVKPGSTGRLVHPIDVAPTLSALLQLPSPAAAQGEALPEALQR